MVRDYKHAVKERFSRYGYDSLEWISQEKKGRVENKHGLDPDLVKEAIKEGDFVSAYPNPSPNPNVNHEGSYTLEIEYLGEEYEVIIYFVPGDESTKVKIMTAY